MADEPPSVKNWLRTQVRRKSAGGGEDTPGTGGGLRLSRGLWVAIILAVVVVVAVLTSDNKGTKTSNSAESASPSASSSESGAPGGQPAAPPPPAAAPPGGSGGSSGAARTPSGTTAFTRHSQVLIVRSEPDNSGEVIARLGFDTQVTLVCHTTGPATYGMGARKSNVWDKVTTPGGNTGYVPDAWVLTAANVDTLVGPC